MKFSERLGLVDASTIIQTDSMNMDLRNSLWSIFHSSIIRSHNFTSASYGNTPNIFPFSRTMWFVFFKRPIDTVPEYAFEIIEKVRSYFFAAQWYEVYDFFEYVIGTNYAPNIVEMTNLILERELSGFRIVDDKFVPVTDDIEIESLKASLEAGNLTGVRSHISQALIHLSSKPKPDTRNAIKEAISAVEAVARVIVKDNANSLGRALTALQKQGKISSFQKSSFEKLYAYTNGPNGIRHALMDESTISVSEAKYFVISCSAFANYLQSIK